MKTFLFFLLGALFTLTGFAQTNKMDREKKLKEKIALACILTDKDQIKRMNELHQTIFKKADRAIEHANNYELLFDKPDSSLNKELFEFIHFEQLCCPWLKFQLSFEPGNGPVSLKLGNSAETKEMANLVMQLDKLRPAK